MTAIIDFFNTIWAYDFMRNAFYAGTIAAVIAAIVGYFIVLRSMSFAGHALGHIGFTGAAGAGLVNLSPPLGQLLLTLVTAVGMGTLGKRVEKSDVVIGIILAFALGLGVLFLYLYKAYATQAMAILFGDLLGVSSSLLCMMLIFSALSLLALALIARPLLFASLEPVLAEAKGISLAFISILFFAIVAIAVTEASQIVGVLLVFTLLIGPAASALNWTRTFWRGILVAVLLGLFIVWAGIILTYLTDWPAAFWISSLSLGVYLVSLV